MFPGLVARARGRPKMLPRHFRIDVSSHELQQQPDPPLGRLGPSDYLAQLMDRPRVYGDDFALPETSPVPTALVDGLHALGELGDHLIRQRGGHTVEPDKTNQSGGASEPLRALLFQVAPREQVAREKRAVVVSPPGCGRIDAGQKRLDAFGFEVGSGRVLGECACAGRVPTEQGQTSAIVVPASRYSGTNFSFGTSTSSSSLCVVEPSLNGVAITQS